MKLKCIPEDFDVEELTTFVPRGGPFALYELSKRAVGTPEAIDVILREWRLPRQRLSYGGLKDKHAVTRQFVTIHQGRRSAFEHSHVQLRYLGQSERAFGPRDISGNRFRITLRDLPAPTAQQIAGRLQRAAQGGLPNYFDDQRFGSVGVSRDFIGRAWCLGDYERALWLALADPHPEDRRAEREQKEILRAHWNQWTECKAALDRSHRRSIVTYLADKPGDFRGAFARLRVDLRGLYLAAFQSHIWNCWLAAIIESECDRATFVSVPLKMGPVPFPLDFRSASSGVAGDLLLPLPSARTRHETSPFRPLLDAVLQSFGLEARQLRVKYPRDSFFSKGSRTAAYTPLGVECAEAADDLYAGRRKLTLRFDLTRGSYATILVKYLTGIDGDVMD